MRSQRVPFASQQSSIKAIHYVSWSISTKAKAFQSKSITKAFQFCVRCQTWQVVGQLLDLLICGFDFGLFDPHFLSELGDFVTLPFDLGVASGQFLR